MTQADCVAIVSGGLDSTVLLYKLVNDGFRPHVLSFNYGQRHSKELQFARATAERLDLRYDVVDLSGLTYLISNSALTSKHDFDLSEEDNSVKSMTHQIEVPEGHYAEDNMKLTVVPNRNMIMLSIAAGVAVNNKYEFVATGVHAGDHFVYPDCRPDFIRAANAAIVRGNAGFGMVAEYNSDPAIRTQRFVEAPFLEKSKADIAYLGLKLDVPFHLTWSCYKGEELHCGKCGTCVERLEAIEEAKLRLYEESDGEIHAVDRTAYADTEFWKTQVQG